MENSTQAPTQRGEMSIPDVDAQLALEIAEFVAERAQEFVDHECRAWALTDFGVWAVLGGRSARLTLEPIQQPSPT